MADWKSKVLQNLVITEETVDYVMEKYGNSWLLDNDVSDEILDDILKREFEKQQRVKYQKGKGDFKATGTDIIDDVDKENSNVEVVIKKPKNKKLKEKILWNVKGVFGWIFKHNLKVLSLRHPFHMKFTNYILLVEVIILDSDTSTYSLDSPPSTHPFKTSSDNEFDSRYEDSCNYDDSWQPTKGVNKITSKSVLKGKHVTSSVSDKGRKGSTSKKSSCFKSKPTKTCKVLKFIDDSSSDDHGNVFRGKPGRSSVYSKGKKRSISKKGSWSNKGSCSKSENTIPYNVLKFYDESSSDDHRAVLKDDVGLSVVSLSDVVEAKKPHLVNEKEKQLEIYTSRWRSIKMNLTEVIKETKIMRRQPLQTVPRGHPYSNEQFTLASSRTRNRRTTSRTSPAQWPQSARHARSTSSGNQYDRHWDTPISVNVRANVDIVVRCFRKLRKS
ncbi:hypothetical protein Tco_0579675 [Tanacetum coccineum]